MTEAMYPIINEGLLEADAPTDPIPAHDDIATNRSPAIYAIPAVAFATAACGGGGSPPSPPPPGSPPVVVIPKPATDTEAARFILKASLAVTEAEITDIKSIGYEAWLNKQIDMPIAETGLAWMSARDFDKVTAEEYFYSSLPGDFLLWNQLMTSPDGVRKRVAFALSEFFVVSSSGIGFNWRSSAMGYYWDQLNSNAFGNFRKLLEDITLNPAMGVFLSTLGNKKEDPRINRVPDENYAREVMQLFSIGLYQLNNDGTNKTDANGQPIETYTNSDVSNLARVFTGYDFNYLGTTKSPSVLYAGVMHDNVDSVIRPMTSDPTKWIRPQTTSEHSPLEATFLGTTVPANTDGPTSLKIALDALFNHANVGPFFAKQMIQRLVTSNPSPAYVDRVAKAFNNNGAGVRGDLRAVFKAILLDTEATDTANLNSPTYGKLREPVLRLAQWGQTFGAVSASGKWQLKDISNPAIGLAQSPLRSPSVFNFFRPGYVPANTAIATNSLVAPEFQIVNEVSIVGYVNFMVSALEGRMLDTGWDVKAVYTKEIAIAHDSSALLNRLYLLLAANQISDSTKATIKTAVDANTVTETSALADKEKRVRLAILLVMASPDYLVQK